MTTGTVSALAGQVTGDFPQNINFAIKGSLVRGFLDIHGVDYRMGTSDAAVGNEAVAAMAQEFVVSGGVLEVAAQPPPNSGQR